MLLYVIIICEIFHWMNIPQFIYPFSCHGHLGYFQFGSVMNEAAINILVYYSG